MDHYQCLHLRCSEDTTLLKNFIEKERIFEFLAGLNIEFDQVRVQVLRKEELPSLNETISIIRAKERRRGAMIEPQNIDGSAMLTNGANIRGAKLNQQTNNESRKGKLSKMSNGDSRDNLWCTFYKKPRHTRERCWKFHGKPSTSSKDWGYKGGQQRNQGQAHLTTTHQGEEKAQDQREFNKEEIEKLKNLLVTLEKPTGTLFIGALSRKIATADGSLSTVAGVGDVKISPSFILKNVLHVPKLSTNLVSINTLMI
ncbi:hypothetical protein OWV82_014593 [Melia azedarach]|uniref:Uncharacterized protein n=1 Tax=Melia azedarach TaxID=155640 RepID=A0ACC1XNV7_MELAZ|nr:hypothetical protein OWV82_014593 [Melia azedarach]